MPGFDSSPTRLDLAERIEEADLVVTGEGFVDAQIVRGQGRGWRRRARRVARHVPVLVVAGEVFDGCEEIVDAVSLVERFGRERALQDTLQCIEEVAAERLKA